MNMVATTDKSAIEPDPGGKTPGGKTPAMPARCGRRSRPGTPGPTGDSCTGSVPPASIAGPPAPAAGLRPTASHSSTGPSRPRPPDSGPANAACQSKKPPAPVWCARSASTSKSGRTNRVLCPPWPNLAGRPEAAPRTCRGCSKRPPESRRDSMRRPGVWTGSRP